MLQHSHCFIQLGSQLCYQKPCSLTKDEQRTINTDLSLFINAHGYIVRNILLQEGVNFNNVAELRNHVLDNPKWVFPLLSVGNGIYDYGYSLFRALHDIIHHVYLGLNFNWDGEATAFELARYKLEQLNADPITIAFVRHDILYNNAWYHYSRKECIEQSLQPFVLEDLCKPGMT